MNIEFMLNGKPCKITITSADRAVDILANDCGVRSLQPICMKGQCGGCLILLDSKPVYSCILPAFLLRSRSVETLEHFEGTREYVALKAEFGRSAINLPPAQRTAVLLLGIWLLNKRHVHNRAVIEKTLQIIHPWHLSADEFADILERTESRLGRSGARA